MSGEATEKPSGTRSRVKDVLLIVVLAAVVVGIFSLPVVCHMRRDKDPRLQEARALVADMNAGQHDRAYKRMTPELRERVRPERFRQVMNETPVLRRAQVGKFTITQPANRLAKVEGEVTTERGRVVVSFFTRRTHTGDEWLVADIVVDGRSLFETELAD
jgi:hypothetical protein